MFPKCCVKRCPWIHGWMSLNGRQKLLFSKVTKVYQIIQVNNACIHHACQWPPGTVMVLVSLVTCCRCGMAFHLTCRRWDRWARLLLALMCEFADRFSWSHRDGNEVGGTCRPHHSLDAFTSQQSSSYPEPVFLVRLIPPPNTTTLPPP